MIYGVHHKTGTHLLQQIRNATADFLGKFDQRNRRTRHLHLPEQESHIQYNCVDAEVLHILHESPRPYKMVHVVRDPLELVISGYWYHAHSYDVQLVHSGPKYLTGLSVEDGLVFEAKAQIVSTLQEITSVVVASIRDEQVLTLGLEDFENDFDGTTSRMFRFFYGDDDQLVEKLVVAARKADNSRWDWKELKKRPKTQSHVNTNHNVVLAKKIISSSTDPIWDQVRDFRHCFGYTEVRPGTFRINPSLMNISACPPSPTSVNSSNIPKSTLIVPPVVSFFYSIFRLALC